MYLYDRARAKKMRFSAGFYWLIFGVCALVSVVGGAGSLCISMMFIFKPAPDFKVLVAFVTLAVGGVLALAALWIGTGPGGSLERWSRSLYRQRVERIAEKPISTTVLRLPRNCRVTLNPDGFVEVADFREKSDGIDVHERTEAAVPWSKVDDILVGDAGAYFLVTGKGVLILPRRAFQEEAAFASFLRRARRYRESAVPAASAITAQAPSPSESPDEHITAS